MKNYRYLALLSLLLVILVVGCSPAPPPATPTNMPAPTNTPDPTDTPEPTPTPSPEPTETHEPTATDEPEPTVTPEPTATSIPPTEPPATDPPATDPPTETEEPGNGGENYAPGEQGVWQLDNDPYATTSAGACAGPYNFNFYGLVGVTPAGEGKLTWRRQDSQTTVQQTSLNNYFGAIPNFLPGYDLQVNVSFTGYENLIVSYVLVEQANPNCTHKFDYRAFRAW